MCRTQPQHFPAAKSANAQNSNTNTHAESLAAKHGMTKLTGSLVAIPITQHEHTPGSL
jgi:hypothetical protein